MTTRVTSVGDMLRAWRPKEMALRLAGATFGVSQTTYRAWEADFSVPDPKSYNSLMAELDIDAATLMAAIVESARRRGDTLASLARAS